MMLEVIDEKWSDSVHILKTETERFADVVYD